VEELEVEIYEGAARPPSRLRAEGQPYHEGKA